MTTGLATRPGGGGKPVKKNRHLRQKTDGTVAPQLPEYLLPAQVEALMKQAPNAQTEVLMLTQWRAGLRISEALGLEVGDLDFACDGVLLPQNLLDVRQQAHRLPHLTDNTHFHH